MNVRIVNAEQSSEGSKLPPYALLGVLIALLVFFFIVMFIAGNQGYVDSILGGLNSLFPLVK
ncbi:MAG TPA: hypothetical protein VJH90_02680 [archaeon]|nr:hypothetical protein [archaeon]